jgi:hypothetical protein
MARPTRPRARTPTGAIRHRGVRALRARGTQDEPARKQEPLPFPLAMDGWPVCVGLLSVGALRATLGTVPGFAGMDFSNDDASS